jgi:hypothetical protein
MSSDHNHDPTKPFNPGPTGRSYDNQIETLADLQRFEASQPDWQIRQNREAAAKARAAAEAARNPGPTGRDTNDDTHGTKFWTDSHGVQHAGPLHPNGSYARGSVHESLQGQQGGFASIRSRTGDSQSLSQATPDSIVFVKGLGEVRMVDAERLGYVSRDGSGGYTTKTDPTSAPAAPPADPAQHREEGQDDGNEEDDIHPDLRVESLDDDAAEGVVAEFADRATQETQTAVIDEMATAGELTEQTAGRVAAEMGLMPEEAEAKMASTRAAFEDQAREAVVDVVGTLVDPQDVLDWLGANDPDRAEQIVKDHIGKRKTSGYREAAQDVLKALPDIVGMDNLMGFDFSDQGVTLSRRKVTGKETLVVETPRGEMSWASALAAGFLKVPGR